MPTKTITNEHPPSPAAPTPAADEARAITAAAEVNGWALVRTVDLDHGGRRYVYATDLSGPGANAPKPGVVTFTCDYRGHLIRSRRDISRRNYISERQRDDTPGVHAFEFADTVFRDVL